MGRFGLYFLLLAGAACVHPVDWKSQEMTPKKNQSTSSALEPMAPIAFVTNGGYWSRYAKITKTLNLASGKAIFKGPGDGCGFEKSLSAVNVKEVNGLLQAMQVCQEASTCTLHDSGFVGLQVTLKGAQASSTVYLQKKNCYGSEYGNLYACDKELAQRVVAKIQEILPDKAVQKHCPKTLK